MEPHGCLISPNTCHSSKVWHPPAHSLILGVSPTSFCPTGLLSLPLLSQALPILDLFSCQSLPRRLLLFPHGWDLPSSFPSWLKCFLQKLGLEPVTELHSHQSSSLFLYGIDHNLNTHLFAHWRSRVFAFMRMWAESDRIFLFNLHSLWVRGVSRRARVCISQDTISSVDVTSALRSQRRKTIKDSLSCSSWKFGVIAFC